MSANNRGAEQENSGSLSPESSMTLSISRDDAQRMMEASRSLNKTLRQLQKDREFSTGTESERRDESSSTGQKHDAHSSHDSPTASNATKNETNGKTLPLHELVMEAATACGDVMIGAFVGGLKERGCTDYEMQTSLLLFLDMDKSAKLMTAFRVLRDVKEPPKVFGQHDDTTNQNSATTSTRGASTLAIGPKGAHSLFRCFLTAIASCIQQDPSPSSKHHGPKASIQQPESVQPPPAKTQKIDEHSSPKASPPCKEKTIRKGDESGGTRIPCQSPSFDSSMDVMSLCSENSVRRLSKATLDEIEEIANFASDHLVNFVKKKHSHHRSTDILFELFGDWYNSGGYSVVPWLELLDLAKWDYANQITRAAEPPPAPAMPVKQEAPVDATDDNPAAKSPTDVQKSSRPTPLNFFISEDSGKRSPAGKTLVTFDFTGSAPDENQQSLPPLCINISEDNLVTLRNLVHRTGLVSRTAVEVFGILLGCSKKLKLNGNNVWVLQKDDFGMCIRDLVPPEAIHSFSRPEMEHFSSLFMTFFGCFEDESRNLGLGCVDVKELAVGFSVMCAGNKSTKLVAGFEFIGGEGSGKLSEQQLVQYVRAYLTMLIGISRLSSNEKAQDLSPKEHQEMVEAVESGARWTLSHFLRRPEVRDKSPFTFENFATWYTDGGYTVAPWLELLDLRKLLALLGEPSAPLESADADDTKESPSKAGRVGRLIPPEEVLFTFPLANDRSLVVLREDATYVRSVVEKLGIVSMPADDVWDSLFKNVKSRPPPPPQPWSRSRHRKSGTGKTMDVDQQTFVRCMEEIVLKAAPKARELGVKASPAGETLANFFQSFDLEQIDRVALNQLMGGLSLLCGGKKSEKLSFSFGLFDGRKNTKKTEKTLPSLNTEELFLFLRSFLIVMFSCCRQSLDMTAEAVVRYISDTAHMVAENVMRYQWHQSKRDRVDFDEFGQWYNEGGFETAPWLELLDLNKWVLLDRNTSQQAQEPVALPSRASTPPDTYCPPAPPDDAVDATSFLDEHPLMPIDSIDEMDFILMQQPSYDKENDGSSGNKTQITLAYSPRPRARGRPNSNSLKFHLVTHEDSGGYMLSVSQKRVQHLRNILLESGLCKVDSELATKKILSKGTKAKGSSRLVLTKSDFDSAIRSIIPSGGGKAKMSIATQRTLSDILAFIFNLFDRKGDGKPDALEVACGCTVLCNGKKSDKLEYAFEVLDINKDGRLSRNEMTNYLESFLTVLLSVATSDYLEADASEDSFLLMNGRRSDPNAASISRAAKAGSEWATSQAFKGSLGNKAMEQDVLSFDDFAEWYTRKGFGSIPWLELLDLRKWVLNQEESSNSR